MCRILLAPEAAGEAEAAEGEAVGDGEVGGVTSQSGAAPQEVRIEMIEVRRRPALFRHQSTGAMARNSAAEAPCV